MRARHRHFNPASAGSFLSLDARFISGKNDGDSLDNFDSRLPATINASATTTLRPTYKTNIINGSPVARFDGNDIMSFSANTTLTNQFSIFVLNRAVNSQSVLLGSDSINGSTSYMGIYTTYGAGIQNENQSTGFVASNPTGNNIIAFSTNSNSVVYYFNGSSNTVGNVSGTFNCARLGGRIGPNAERLNGDLALAASFSSFPAESLRKKVSHAIAYSFKIACS